MRGANKPDASVPPDPPPLSIAAAGGVCVHEVDSLGYREWREILVFTQRGDPVGFSNELRVSAIPGGLCITQSYRSTISKIQFFCCITTPENIDNECFLFCAISPVGILH